MSSAVTVYPGIQEGMSALHRLYTAVAGGTVATDLKRSGKDGWLFIGMAERVTLGDPDEEFVAQAVTQFTDEHKLLLLDARDAIEKQSAPIVAEGDPQALSLPPAVWSLLLTLIQELLKKLITG